jgi:hypothetical protein
LFFMSHAPEEPETETAEARLGRHCGMLRRLEDLAMMMAEAITLQAQTAAQAGELDGGRASLALNRAAKVVRQCVALEDRLRQTPSAAPQSSAYEEVEADRRRLDRRLWQMFGRDMVREAVEKVIARAAPCEREAERLLADLKDRMEHEDKEAETNVYEIGRTVERLCEGLGLGVDWSLWKGQTWADEYVGALACEREYASKQRRAGRVNGTGGAMVHPPP